jgi:hypothetical protein
MVFKKFKKMIKKISTLLASATLAAGICSPFANAVAPGVGDRGAYVGPVGIIRLEDLMDQYGNIDKNIPGATPVYEIIKSGDYTYDGNLHKIIYNVKFNKDLTDEQLAAIPGYKDWKVYLRVASSLTAEPREGDWVLWDGQEAFTGANITEEHKDGDANPTANVNTELRWQRVNAGKYYVFYYIDGGPNYTDYDGTADASAADPYENRPTGG